MFSLTGSGYYGKGLGTTLPVPRRQRHGRHLRRTAPMTCGSPTAIGQVTFTPANSKVTIAGS